VLGSEPPRWEQSFREVGLVALQAAVLTRRIFLPRAGRDDLAPEQWQMLLALALSETASYAHPAASVESLATQLSLDRELAEVFLFGLLRDRLVVADDQEEERDPVRFTLSPEGWAAARAYIERAGRFLPGWPPERPPTP
jgi:DNA-binding MarR family transcriptional regulator